MPISMSETIFARAMEQPPTRLASRATLPTGGRDRGGTTHFSEQSNTVPFEIPPLDGEGGSRSEPGGVSKRRGIARARSLRRRMTPQEVKLWVRLRELREQGLYFRRQAPLLGYVLDFVCFDRRLVVEADGSQHAIGRQQARDQRRDVLLDSEGFRVLRIWNADVDRDLDAVIETIFTSAMQQPPTRRRLRGDTLPAGGRDCGGKAVDSSGPVSDGAEEAIRVSPQIPSLDGEGGSRSEPGVTPTHAKSRGRDAAGQNERMS